MTYAMSIIKKANNKRRKIRKPQQYKYTPFNTMTLFNTLAAQRHTICVFDAMVYVTAHNYEEDNSSTNRDKINP